MPYTALVLLLVLAVSTATSGAAVLADIQYTVPNCLVEDHTLANSFGELALTNDVLTGQQLQLGVTLDDTQTSCKLCQLLPARDCDAPLGNASNLRLASDTRYNVRVWVADDAAPLDRSAEFSLVLQDGRAVSIDTSDAITASCGQTLRLVVTVLATIDHPRRRDFVLIATDSPDDVMPCMQVPSQQALSCHTTLSYYYVTHAVRNCLATTTGGEETRLARERLYYDPYHYYYELVYQNNAESLGVSSAVLCGESWVSIFKRARLDEYCAAPDLALYVRMKPWYEAALLTMSAWLNGRQQETVVWLALATLERSCAQRDTVQLDLNDTIFYNMSLLLREAAPVNGQETVCSWLPVVASNITRPWYVTHITDWYFDTFKYLLPLNADMPSKAMTLVVMPILVLIIVVAGSVLTVWHVCYRPGEFAQSNNAYMRV